MRPTADNRIIGRHSSILVDHLIRIAPPVDGSDNTWMIISPEGLHVCCLSQTDCCVSRLVVRSASLETQTIQAVDECRQLRGRLPKTSGVPNIIPIGPLYVALCELRTR